MNIFYVQKEIKYDSNLIILFGHFNFNIYIIDIYSEAMVIYEAQNLPCFASVS
jgi:hypothetical protein